MDPTLHRGIRKAGNLGAHSGITRMLEKDAPVEFSRLKSDSQNFCRTKYGQCKKLHDSYRFPGISKRYMSAAIIAKNHRMMANQSREYLQDQHIEEMDEYHAHEKKIFNTFKNKVDIHELEKWLATSNIKM